MFRAILIEKDDSGYHAAIHTLNEDRLPEGEVQLDLAYSTLNYKDALAITGKSPIARILPLIPGVDLSGTVTRSSNEHFRVGQKVLATGWGMGEGYWGGLSQKASVPGNWLVPLPDFLSVHDVMAIGTAGFTAMLCVRALQRHGVTPEHGEIIVTGAAGGVGSVAVTLLAKLGYQVIASTGRVEESTYLKELGAAEIIDRQTLSSPGRPLTKARWAGAIDTVGSHTLANVCAATADDGVVTACGLAQGMDFPSTVAPFILRGVSLIGINSVTCPQERRLEAWKALADHFQGGELAQICNTTVGLQEALDLAPQLLAGRIRGRVVVDVNR